MMNSREDFWWRDEHYEELSPEARRDVDFYYMYESPSGESEMKAEFLGIVIVFGLIGLVVGLASL